MIGSVPINLIGPLTWEEVKMNNLARSVKTFSQMVSLLLGEDFIRPIEKVMKEYPYSIYHY